MKKTLLIGILALAVTGVEVQAQAVSVNDNSSVRTENSADILRRGGGPGRGGGRRGGDWDRGGGRRGGDWNRGGRGGRFWPRPGRDWDNDQYVCHARGNRSRMLYRGDGWSRSSARSEALNRCYRNTRGCYITSCYRD